MDLISDLGDVFLSLPGAAQSSDVLRLMVIVLAALGGVGLVLVGRFLVSLISHAPEKKHKPRPKTQIKITLEEFVQLRRRLKAALQKELGEAEGTERERISARLAELSARSAKPAVAMEETQQQIEEIERLLVKIGQTVSSGLIDKACAAMERVDFSLADQIFSEIELEATRNPERSAIASFGRGKIAEIEFRWHHAVEHFARAARLKPDYDNLFKASTYLWLNGRGQEAIWFEEDLVAFMRREFGSSDPRTANVRNNHAGSLYAVGEFARAEEIMIDVLRLGRHTIGFYHPDTAAHLNTLALVVGAQGRHGEAEEYYRQAVEVDRETIGEKHHDFATRLGDLATAIEMQGRFDEAEALFRQVLETDRATIGETHPDYAIHLNNLAGVVEAQSRFPEAAEHYANALSIIENALGSEHPNTCAVRRNLESLREKTQTIGKKRTVLAAY